MVHGGTRDVIETGRSRDLTRPQGKRRVTSAYPETPAGKEEERSNGVAARRAEARRGRCRKPPMRARPAERRRRATAEAVAWSRPSVARVAAAVSERPLRPRGCPAPVWPLRRSASRASQVEPRPGAPAAVPPVAAAEEPPRAVPAGRSCAQAARCRPPWPRGEARLHPGAAASRPIAGRRATTGALAGGRRHGAPAADGRGPQARSREERSQTAARAARSAARAGRGEAPTAARAQEWRDKDLQTVGPPAAAGGGTCDGAARAPGRTMTGWWERAARIEVDDPITIKAFPARGLKARIMRKLWEGIMATSTRRSARGRELW